MKVRINFISCMAGRQWNATAGVPGVVPVRPESEMEYDRKCGRDDSVPRMTTDEKAALAFVRAEPAVRWDRLEYDTETGELTPIGCDFTEEVVEA